MSNVIMWQEQTIKKCGVFFFQIQIRDNLPECLTSHLTHRLPLRSDSERNKEESENASHSYLTPRNVGDPNSFIKSQATCRHTVDYETNQSASARQTCMPDEEDNPVDNQQELPLYEKHKEFCRPLKHYLDKKEDFTQWMIPEKFLKRFWVMDIVTGESRNSCCFTKR